MLFRLNLSVFDTPPAYASTQTFYGFDDLQVGVLYPLVGSNSALCNVSFVVNNSTRQLLPQPLVDAQNYALNNLPSPYQTSFACGWRVGSLQADGSLTYPGCGDQDPCGGHALYRSPGTPGMPLYVPPDPRFVVPTCDLMYPVSNSFNTYRFSGNDGGSQIVDVGYACYAPFVRPDLINETSSTAERYRQCFLLRGNTAGVTWDCCFRDKGERLCDQGWIFFGEYCYYKPDAYTELNYKVGMSDAESICQNALGGSTQLWNPTTYQRADDGSGWLNW